MPTMFYVTGLAVLSGSDELPRHRTDMAKYFTRADAETHLAKLRSPNYFDLRIEEREDHEGDGHAHGFQPGEVERMRRR